MPLDPEAKAMLEAMSAAPQIDLFSVPHTLVRESFGQMPGGSPAATIEMASVESRDIDGPAGFPDGSLDSSFEDVQIRLFNDTIQLRSSTGGFQPLVKNASAFEASLGIRLVRVEVTATSQALFRVRRDSLDSIHIVYCLWNLRPELFPPDTEVVP